METLTLGAMQFTAVVLMALLTFKLLAHPEWGFEAVADYCGFNSREYFHRIFKEHQGMTPAQYQKQHGVIPQS
ncbi:MAG: AraC family transcriptional regulator [Prevotella sp.]|nr:AraC family transcriptional regulator [Prevotella sp.]